jgi:hypothetical protein
MPTVSASTRTPRSCSPQFRAPARPELWAPIAAPSRAPAGAFLLVALALIAATAAVLGGLLGQACSGGCP